LPPADGVPLAPSGAAARAARKTLELLLARYDKNVGVLEEI
jgi:hypothetical protein